MSDDPPVTEEPEEEQLGSADDNPLPDRPEPSLAERIEQEQKESRLRTESLQAGSTAVGQDWYGGSTYRAENGGAVYGASRDLHITHVGGEDDSALHTPFDVDWLDTCFVATRSHQELLERLTSAHALFLRGDRSTGRLTVALSALKASGVTCNRLRIKEPRKLRPDDLEPGGGYVLRADEEPWSRHRDGVIDLLQAVAAKRSALIVVLVTSECTVTGHVVDHKPPATEEVFEKWLEHHLAGLDIPHDHELRRIDENVRDIIAGCSPGQAYWMAGQCMDGIKRGLALADVVRDLPHTNFDQLRKKLSEEIPILGRCFLISSAVLHGLPEANVSAAALTLAARVRREERAGQDKDEDDGPGIPVWERLATWLSYPGLSAVTSSHRGQSQRIDIRRGMATRLLTMLWEELPAVREPLYDWLDDLVGDDDWRIRLKAAHAVGRLATCDFDVIDTRYLTPWSNQEGSGKILTWALEAAANDDPDVEALVHGKLAQWTTGSRLQHLAAALAYGSRIGVANIHEALRTFQTITITAQSLESCDAVARSVSEVYGHQTAQAILSELAGWTTDSARGRRLTAALAFVRIASFPEDAEVWPALVDHPSESDLARLWANALSWGLSRDTGDWRRLAFTASAWDLVAGWVSQAAMNPKVNTVLREVLNLATPRLRPAWVFHLMLWRQQKTISVDQFIHFTSLAKGG